MTFPPSKLIAIGVLAIVVGAPGAANSACSPPCEWVGKKKDLCVCPDKKPPKKPPIRIPPGEFPIAAPTPKPPKPKPKPPCPAGQVLNRNGLCAVAGQCRPGHVFSGPAGGCIPAGRCRPGHIFNSTKGVCVPG